MIYEIIYWGLIILSLIDLFCFYNNINIKKKRIIDVLILLLFIFLAGGRFQVGLDYGSYERYFNEAQIGLLSIFNNISEPAFILLCKIVPTYRMLLFTIATISVLCTYVSFQKEKCTSNVFMMALFFATYFIFYDMGVMRQGIAISICLYSLKYVENKDKRFFLLLLIALNFHLSSICFLPIYFIGNKQFSRKVYYIVLIVSLIILLSGFSFSNIINYIIVNFGGQLLSHKYLISSSINSRDSIISLLRRLVFSTFFIEVFKRQSINFGRFSILKTTNWRKYLVIY